MEGFSNPRYFDYAASSPPWQESIEAFANISQLFYGNPSSNHMPGREARQKLLGLKKEFCDLLNFFDGRLLLCASGSEANNTIIEGHLQMFPNGKLLIAEDVHESIWYATKNFPKVTEVLKIDTTGQIHMDKFEKALSGNISLVCTSHACNETGTIHPVKEMADLCYRKQVRILIDGAQTIGHLPLNLGDIPFTYFSFSGHKFGSVKSSGGILIRDDQFESLIHGGQQEWSLRAGTEDIAGLASMVVALEKSINQINEEMIRLKKLNQLILKKLHEISHIKINSPDNSLPGLLSVSFPGRAGSEIVGALSMAGFAISTGSACHENQLDPSRIIQAMGRSRNEAIGSIRISMGSVTTSEAVNDLIKALLDLVS